MTSRKVEAVQVGLTLRNQKQLRSFLCLLQTSPLNELLRKEHKVEAEC